ncbi:FAD-dependent oxidoreductase [Chloroflexota bacterium]
MSNKVSFEKLFEPGNIGTMELKNRIIMPPMGNRLTGLWSEVTDTMIEWYTRRARGGAGLIVVQSTHVATAFQPLSYTTRSPRADDDSYFPGLFQLAEAIHDAGAKAGINLQVGHGLKASSGPWWPLGREFLEEGVIIAPSPLPSPQEGKQVRALTISEIEKIVELIGHAAGRIKQVGFDTIEINAHAGYILSEFMSPFFNRRTDKYGGSLDNRLRFLSEVIESIRGKVGPDYPLIIKYAVEENIEGGLDIKEGLAIAQRLEQQGINAISISVGTIGATKLITASYYSPEAHALPLAEAVKQVVRIPIILSGKLGKPELAEQVLKDNKADFIGLGRPLIADPDWPDKVAEGHSKEVRYCISCNECLRVSFVHKAPIRCTVNATAGREREYGTIVPAARTKRITIVGAGPAGMEAALVAALRDHKVTLYERTNELGGGQLKLASMPPHKEVLKNIVDYYSEKFKQLNNIDVKLGKAITAQDILNEKPDAVIVATGGEPVTPNVAGIDKSNVITVFDLLTSKTKAGETVIVVGGGSLGCETANFLAQQGKKVTIVEMLETIGTEMDKEVWLALGDELSRFGVHIMTGVQLVAVTNQGATLIDKEGHETLVKADTIVLACGMKPVNTLAKDLSGKVKEIYTIGDASQPRTIRNAVADGFALAFRI